MAAIRFALVAFLAAESITLDVSPRIAFEPAHVMIRTHLDLSEELRMLRTTIIRCVAQNIDDDTDANSYDCDTENPFVSFTASEQDVQPGPEHTIFRMVTLPQGRYKIAIALFLRGKKVLSRDTMIRVLESVP